MSRARDIANYGDGIDTSSINSGTFADARIAASNVTQHEGSIDALASNPTVTLGSNATFPSGHIINIQEFTNSDTTDVWNSQNWRSVVSGAHALSNSSNKLLFKVQASIGKSISAVGLYGQITSKDGTGSSLDHDGTALTEGINPISGNTSIQRVPFGVVGGNIYSNQDFVDYITGYIVHSPGTTDSKQYQFQCRGRSDSAYTFHVNRTTSLNNAGYEIYGICRMLIMEFVA